MESFEMPKIFFLEETFTYGVTHGKYGGYDVPIVFEEGDAVLCELKKLAFEKNAELSLYGSEKNKLYLTTDQLSEKQRDELLGKGKMIVRVQFHATGTYRKKNGKLGLKLVLVGMKKIKVPERVLRPIPEDEFGPEEE